MCIRDSPNVSPKEVFVGYGEKFILIANIASPQSLKNIQQNDQVCVSFVDILIQKGFKLKGKAKIIQKGNDDFLELANPLVDITKGKYPFQEIFKIEITNVKPIIAPGYFLYPDITTEASQRASALKQYRFLE